jgi:chemotaxis protein histidine kinase CheA
MASSKTVTVGRVEALEGRVGSLEGNVEGSVGEVAALRERVATLEERLAVLEAAPVGKAKGAKGTKAASAGGGKKERVKKEAPPLPEAVEGAPEASEYRLPEGEIQESVCIGRLFSEPDKRWSPHVYREVQCGGELADGEELCTTCSRRQDKFAETSKPGPWNGIVTEDPPEWAHMLGSAWADERKPRWRGEGADSASEASSVSAASAGGSKPGKKPAKSAEEKAAEKAEKDAAAAAKKAEKAAAAAAEKAEKEAAKAAEKAAKAAEKEAEKAAKAAEKAASAKKPVAKKEKVASTAAAAVAAPAAVAAYTIKMIEGEFYAICGSDVFEFDSMLEEKGALVGHMDGDTFVPLTAAAEEEDDAGAE